MDNAEFQQHAQRVDQAVERATSIPDEAARTIALELMQSLMDLHGSGLTRIVEVLAESGEPGRNMLAELGRDPLICGLLVLYGIHPVPLEDRIADAVNRVAPQVRKQGGTLELLSVREDGVKLSIQTSGSGCHSSPDALKQSIEQAIREAAPEMVEIICETNIPAGFVPLTNLQTAPTKEKTYEESAA
jgi:Fe-S cluster biogenesis protein NfuA